MPDGDRHSEGGTLALFAMHPPVTIPSTHPTTGRRLDGVALARTITDQVRADAATQRARGVAPRLVIVRVGDDPASSVYVGRKVKAGREAGIDVDVVALPATATGTALHETVAGLNADASVHGVIVQLPLPAGLDPSTIIASVAPDKDVDGLHPVNAGRLWDEREGFAPCTAAGSICLLESNGIAIEGQEAVVVGRSHLIGRPVAVMLTNRGATVTVCHSRTRDLAMHTRRADILVVAAGRPGLVTGDMVKPGAAVVDVGINRLPDGKLAGDVAFEAASRVAGWITPVPGGVGPMTVAMLLRNTVAASIRRGSV
jgi:methylenetetrahydrofolate dehydrogenase (NADP+)/methenyltetrahydrofolate cyclohydrolase